MNISYSWLRKYVDLPLTPEETARALTSLGLEVGGVVEFESIPGGLEGVVIGKVLTCVPHPNSDHLHITTVDIGADDGGVVQIVCGAPNISAGLTVPVATVGTTLYSDEGPFKIKKSKIRGEESFGMICSEVEIGVGSDASGIMILPDDLVAGTPAGDYFEIKKDAVIEIDITPNRSDATSHYGVARDLYAYLMTRGMKTALHTPEAEVYYAEADPLSVQVSAQEGCLRYSGVVIEGITVAPSPEWLQEALHSIGQKPINNVVDITNFVLFELGQPLHAFDLNAIDGVINVRYARPGEKLTTLEGQEHELMEKDVVIANSREALCLGGVMGGLGSGVSDSTTAIFLESATFHPTYVRKTARRYGLSTDSSFRFERGLDPKATDLALRRAASLIVEVCGGNIASKKYDIVNGDLSDRNVDLNLSKVNDLTGIKFEEQMVLDILKYLDIRVTSRVGDILSLEVPAYRYDVTRDVDVIEDILRVYGYDKVPMPTTVKGTVQYPTPTDRSVHLQRLIAEQLTGAGFNEILNNSLSKESYYTEEGAESAVRVINALSSDLSVMRQTLLYGGLESISRNLKRRNANLRFYEFGSIYRKSASDEQTPTPGYAESFCLGIWMTGDESAPNWVTGVLKRGPFELKAIVQNVLTRLGISERELEEKATEGEYPFESGMEISSKRLGILVRWGIVDPQILNTTDIEVPVYYAEFDWRKLMKLHESRKITIADIPKYPAVKRDFALLVDENVSFEEIRKLAMKSEKKLLRSVTLFDVYEDPKHLPPGKKSYAVSFELRDEEKTLSDGTIQAVMKKIFGTLHKELGAELR